MPKDRSEISILLERVATGDRKALDELMPMVYTELRAIAERHMQRENQSHSLQPTELIHEVYVRLIGSTAIQWQGHAHFMAVASTAMRRALVDHARARKAKKRGGGGQQVSLTESLQIGENPALDLLDLEAALEELGKTHERKVQVVELLYFGGLTAREAAEALGVTSRAVERDWRFARAWLFDRLSPEPDGEPDERTAND